MVTAEAPITIDNPLRRLVGDFEAQEVHGSPDDPDEGGSGTPSFTVGGLRDNLDILEARMQMDPTELGILAGRISAASLHESDRLAIQRDVEAQARHHR